MNSNLHFGKGEMAVLLSFDVRNVSAAAQCTLGSSLQLFHNGVRSNARTHCNKWNMRLLYTRLDFMWIRMEDAFCFWNFIFFWSLHPSLAILAFGLGFL